MAFGITNTGFVTKQQQTIIAELNASLQAVFGPNINLLPESNFGQFVSIWSEREALLWQLAEAVYNSQYPAGAEGSSVDNILSLTNLRRLPAMPTRTNPNPLTQSNGITLYGLVLTGTPGTLIPAGSIVQTSATPPVQFTIDNNATIQAAKNAIQSLFMSNTPTTGQYSLSIVDTAGNMLTTQLIEWNAPSAQTLLTFSATPASSTSFKLALEQAGATLTTAAIVTNGAFPTAAAIQTAITALAGYSGVTVSGSAGSYTITWGSIANPLTTVTANTTTVTITPVDSVQAAVNNLFDSGATDFPYTDVVASVNASGFNFTFGSGTVVVGQPTSSDTPQALMTIASNTLQMGATVTNLEVINSQQGAPAEAIASATCTVNGPNFVAAGSLNTIGTSISGWNGVDNQLDCVTGSNVESDTAALTRRAEDLSALGNGPLAAIIEKVSLVNGVTAVKGFQNLNEAALQFYTFNVTPVSGTYQLNINGLVTAPIAFGASSGAVQLAIRALTGFGNALVTGSLAAGYTVDFNGAYGGQPIPLMIPASNTTGSTLLFSFGRPGKSFEIVVEGGSNTDIANAIRASQPAGIQSFGSTTVQVFDQFGNPYNISFSRPSSVPIYVVLTLTTDLLTAPEPQFNPASIATIQQDIVNIINSVPIGGLVIGFGSNGIVGAFNSVPGINFYTLFFDRSPNPVTNSNIQLNPEEAAQGQTFLVQVSYT